MAKKEKKKQKKQKRKGRKREDGKIKKDKKRERQREGKEREKGSTLQTGEINTKLGQEWKIAESRNRKVSEWRVSGGSIRTRKRQ